MVSGPSFVAASSLFALSFGAPIFHSHHARAAHSLVERGFSYQVFSGEGTTAQGWPAETSWKSFEDAWSLNLPTISISCGQFSVPENSATEIAAIKAGLTAASETSGVSSSYLLAIMMQESKGCVRAPTTNYGVRNPGLFQDFNGVASCNDGTVISPCPDETIAKMIAEGAGIGMEVGLSIGIAATGDSDVSKYYKAARIYNSGSVDPSGNLGAGIATHCYASDIANRLTGWTTETSSCNEATIGSINGGSPSEVTPADPVTTSAAPVTSDIPMATSAIPSATAVTSHVPAATSATVIPEVAAPVDATPATPVDSTTPSKPYPSAASGCKSWHEVVAGDNCVSTGLDLPTLRSFNAGLDANCSNLWLGYSYCTAA